MNLFGALDEKCIYYYCSGMNGMNRLFGAYANHKIHKLMHWNKTTAIAEALKLMKIFRVNKLRQVLRIKTRAGGSIKFKFRTIIACSRTYKVSE